VNQNHLISGIKLLKNEIPSAIIDYADVRGYFLKSFVQEKLMQMQSAGLIDHYIDRYIDRKYLDLMAEDSEKTPLTFGQLSIGFQLFFIFLGVGTFAFLVEISQFYLKKYKSYYVVEAFKRN